MKKEVVISQLKHADSMYRRIVGLLGKNYLLPGHGLLITHCNQVHTFFMRFAIDVVFLDGRYCIVKVCRNIRPWRLSPLVWKSKAVLELRQGGADGLEVGDQLQVRGNVVKKLNKESLRSSVDKPRYN